jgi:hypothetical protein
MSFTIDENIIAVQNCSPAYTVTQVNLETSTEQLPPSPPESYSISSTVVVEARDSSAETEDFGFGTHVREVIDAVREWSR